MFDGKNPWPEYNKWMDTLYNTNHAKRLIDNPSMVELSPIQSYELDQRRGEVVGGYKYHTATEDGFEMYISHGWTAYGWYASGNRRFYILIKRVKL